MKMDIRYVSDSGLSRGTVNLIKVLRHDKRFQDALISIRKQLTIPAEGYGEDLKQAANSLKKRIVYKGQEVSKRSALELASLEAVKNFNLPLNWAAAIRQLVLFDIAFIYEEEITLSAPGHEPPPRPLPLISVNLFGKVTRRQLDKWLDENFETIQRYIEIMKAQKPNKIRRQNLELMIEAWDLKKSDPAITVEDISKKLAEKYQDNEAIFEKVTDLPTVRNWISRLDSDLAR